MIRVFLVAGEPSGDRLGAALMAGLKKAAGGQVLFEGVGGPLMEAEGLNSLFPMSEISIIGLVEILREYPALRARIRQTADAVVASHPDVLVTIDIPEFSLRVSRLVKAVSDTKVIHYVAPSVWAWRPGRAARMAAHVDHVLALLPFEPPYMTEAGMGCDFVGHPVTTEPQATDSEIAAFRVARDMVDSPVCLLLPGSRRSEIARLLPVFQEVVARLAKSRPDLRFVLPAAEAVADMVMAQTDAWDVPVTVIDPHGPDGLLQKRAAFGAADVALAASGTVSLELAAAGTPMVIAYDMTWLSRQFIARMLRVDSVTLVNLVAESRLVPEFIGARCQPDLIAPAVLEVLDAPDAQHEALTLTMARLGRGGTPPGERAAQAVLNAMSARKTRH